MFKSGIISLIISSIFGFGSPSPKLEVVPVQSVRKNPVSTTTTQNTKIITATSAEKATSTINITATTSEKIKIRKPAIVKSKSIKTTSQAAKKIESIETLKLPDFEPGKINDAARVAIVNILCTTNGNSLSPISGTGVVISQNGIVLTNAHIGQYFLLKDYKKKNSVECVIRQGSPAYPKFKVELMYISPTWIKNNSTILKEQDPKGTGEDDFALLRITEKIDGSEMPQGFPYLIPDVRENIIKREPVVLISYPAGFLGGISILQGLNVTSAITNIQNYYTFKDNTIDLIDVGGTVVSQKGSSGGAVIDSFATLLGIITTSSEEYSTSQRELRAITLAHINRTLEEELGFGLNTLLSQDPEEFSKSFASTTAPGLTKIITDELSN